MSQKPTKWALRSLEADIVKLYLDLQKLREVRRAEINFGIHIHSPKGARSKQRLH
jgi:hypothetical protein